MLPLHRTEFIKPFLVVRVDFAGPILYKRTEKETGKAHIALFTCSSTCAVHLRLAPDLSASVFIKTLKEFVARRATPKLIISGNTRIFTATKKWLKVLLQNHELNDYLVNQRIEWRFNLARAPRWGGFFQRLIAIMKRSLSKAIGRGFLTYSELEEVLLDVECVTNNRPLCYQGEDFENEVITPNILLRGRPARLLEEDLQKLNEEDNVTKRLIYVKICKEELRKRWTQGYLYALKEREKTCAQKQIKMPTVGSLVLLVEDTKNRGTWKTGIMQQEVH